MVQMRMIRQPSDHPVNQSNNELLGRLSGGFSLPESNCQCSVCDTDLDHGQSVTVFALFQNPSIRHRWSRRALFCRQCAPNSLDADLLDDYRRGSFEALVTGTLRDKAYFATVKDENGEWTKEKRRQDRKYAEFAATRVEDRRADAGVSFWVTDVGQRQFRYCPAEYGETVAVPAAVLKALMETTEAAADTRTPKASGTPTGFGQALLNTADGPTQSPWDETNVVCPSD